MVNVVVTHAGKMQFTGESESDYTVNMDASPAFGGENAGIKPMELLLMSLGGCSGMDVIDILRKKKQEVTDYKINISGERRDDYPKVFTKIKVEHVVKGKNIDPAAVKRAVELSTDKYCSVIGMVKEATDLEVSYRIEEG
jgi:putative redox protein